MTVEESLEFFNDIPAIYDRFKTMDEVGLGYLELGQSATTLSGGEAQRKKFPQNFIDNMYKKLFIFWMNQPSDSIMKM